MAPHKTTQKPATAVPAASWTAKVPTKAFVAIIILVCVAFFNRVIFGMANFWEDLLYQELPHRIFARDVLMNFQFPHWNPFTFNGMPFFAATHTGVLYPTNLLLSVLPLSLGPFWYALELSIIAHIAVAGVTMFYFCSYRSLSRTASLFAALSYMLCGFFAVHVIHSLMLYILAWLPLIMLLMQRGAEKDRRADFVYAGIILGITILAGHPQITFYEFLFLGAFAIYLLAFKSKHKAVHAGLMAALFAIAGGLAMVLLLPAAELAGESARVTWTFEMASEGSVSFRQLLTFLIPKLFGETTPPGSWREAVSFWLNDAYHSGYWTYWETTFYTGFAAFVLGMVQLVTLKKSRFALFCAIWFVVSLAIALGSSFFAYRILFDHVPGFGTFRVPARILFTWNLLLPILAARTIDQLRSSEGRELLRRPLLIAGGVCLAAGLLAPLGIMQAFAPELANQTIKTYAVSQSAGMLAMLAVAAVATLLLYRRLVRPTPYAVLMACLLCTDLFVFGAGYHTVDTNSRYNPEQYFGRNRQLTDFLVTQSKFGLFRTKMREGGAMLLDRNQGMIDKIQLMEGYNPLNLFRHILPAPQQTRLDLFNVKYAIQVDSAAGTMGLAENPGYLPRAGMLYAAKVFKSDTLVKEYLESTPFDYTRVVLLEEKPAITLPDSVPAGLGGTAAVVRYHNNRIDLSVETPENGILWLSEIWYPAWKVLVDGKESTMLRANYSFRAVAVPKGSHTVSFVYNSRAFRLGMLISILTLLCAITAALLLRRNRTAVKC